MNATWKTIAAGTGRFVKRLALSREGGTAMMFALSLPFLTVAAVAGVDIHRATSVRSSLQDAVDAANLAAARSNETTDAGIRRVAMNVLRANLANFPNVVLNENAAVTDFDLRDDGSVVAKARASVNTLVAGAFLGSALDVNVASTVYRSNNRVEVALVIDNTGSMAQDGKLDAAEAAATNLVNRLAAADARSVEDDAVRISLVPFSQTVRVDSGFSYVNSTSNRTSANSRSWLSRSLLHTGYNMFGTVGADRFALLDQLRTGWGGCVESRAYPYDVQDTAPSSLNQSSMFVPYFAPDDPDRTDLNDSTWRGWYSNGWTNNNDYVDDIEGNQSGTLSTSARTTAWNTRLRNVLKYQYSRLNGTLNTNLGPNKGCSLQPIIRLTDNFTSINNSISNMQAVGTTNIPMGLMWGWHTLSPRAPFADGRPYGEERLTKIIILLTDGDNTNNESNVPDDSYYTGLGLIWQNRLGSSIGIGSTATQRRNAMDARLAELCDNLRANEIVLYTVGVGVDTRTQQLLGNCATENDMFYNVSNTDGIATAFDRIAGSIENLRIAR